MFRSHGVSQNFRQKDLENGIGVSLFILGFAPDGRPVGGLRFYGPLDGSYQAAIMGEMAASPEIGDIAALIDREVPHGVLEVKGVWSRGEAMTGIRLGAALSRSVTYAMNWLGAELAVAASFEAILPIGLPTGARKFGAHSVPYPDERYQTIAVTWRRSRSHELSDATNQMALRLEAEQLSRGPSRLSSSPVEPASTQTMSWRPHVLDVGTRSEREVLRVLREDSSLQIIDRLGEQREQLSQVKPTPSRSLLDEGQRWVYYPWRRAVVRLLGPRGFATLRLDRNRNKLTRAEQDRQRTLRIGVVGVSSGHSIAHVLAMEGLAGEIRLADFDTLELSNLNRVPASVLDLGVNKAVVAARRIAEIDPYLKVVVVPEGIGSDNLNDFLAGLDLVIEECDSLDVKFLVREAARERRIPVLMETSDRGVLDVERYDLEPDLPIFHGLMGDMDAATLSGLSLAEKGPYLLRMIGPRELSARAAASGLELGQTITAWPQLASEVTLGAATAAAAVRRIGLARDLPSGRVRFDMEEVMAGLTPVVVDTETEKGLQTPPPVDPLPETTDPVELIVDAARRAPSGGNVQPWRFEASSDEIRFFMVPERTSKMDVQHRGSYVGLGAAIFNARVTAASLHRLGTVQLFPRGHTTHHVATMRLGRSRDMEIAQLSAHVHARVTNRQLGHPSPIADGTIHMLERAVGQEGASLRFVTERDKVSDCAEVLAESDRLRFLIPEVQHQMFGELRWPGRDSLEDGMDVRTLEMDPFGYAAIDLMARPDVMGHLADWQAGQSLGARTRFMVESSSALAAITVPRAEPLWYVRGGLALERFWLSAETYGLALQPVSPVFLFATDENDILQLGGERNFHELMNLSQRFNELWDLDAGETVVMLLRVIHAPPPSVRSVRLPLAEVLSREDDSVVAMRVS
jgi:molybdopterin/thiamine biosynthesis adenylyltransferase